MALWPCAPTHQTSGIAASTDACRIRPATKTTTPLCQRCIRASLSSRDSHTLLYGYNSIKTLTSLAGALIYPQITPLYRTVSIIDWLIEVDPLRQITPLVSVLMVHVRHMRMLVTHWLVAMRMRVRFTWRII